MGNCAYTNGNSGNYLGALGSVLQHRKIQIPLQPIGEVSEWLKEHAWKVCIRQKCIEGSNPFLSAK